MSTNTPVSPAIIYPESDGKPMAENTLQAEWIVTIFGNLQWLFAQRSDVFVAMDNFWYPLEAKPKIRKAPDVYVVFGRPKGHRGSYRQWEEDNIPIHVVFEVLSPGNRIDEMVRKFRFYQKYGVEEYYIIDPQEHTFEAWHRTDQRMRSVKTNRAVMSPRLGVRFEYPAPLYNEPPTEDVRLFHPDGKPFLTLLEIEESYQQAKQTAAAAQAQASAYAAKLRELGIDPDTIR